MTTCCHTGVSIHNRTTLLQLEADLCHIVDDLCAAVASVLWLQHSDTAELPAVLNRPKSILTIARDTALQDAHCAHRLTDAWTERC